MQSARVPREQGSVSLNVCSSIASHYPNGIPIEENMGGLRAANYTVDRHNLRRYSGVVVAHFRHNEVCLVNYCLASWDENADFRMGNQAGDEHAFILLNERALILRCLVSLAPLTGMVRASIKPLYASAAD